MKRWQANLLLVAVNMIWGGGFVVTDVLLKSVTPFQLMTLRFLGAAIPPLLFIRQWRQIKKDVVKSGILIGVLLFFLFYFQTNALTTTPAGRCAFLCAVNVVLLPYFLWIINKRRPLHKEIFASLFCLGGVALMSMEGFSGRLAAGDIYSLLCAVFMALHVIVLENSARTQDVMLLTFLQMLTAGILSFLCMLWQDGLFHLTWASAGSVGYLVLINTFLAYLLQTVAQKYTNANTVSMIMTSEALFTAFFSFLFLQERISWQTLAGGMIIVTSVFWLEYRRK